MAATEEGERCRVEEFAWIASVALGSQKRARGGGAAVAREGARHQRDGFM